MSVWAVTLPETEEQWKTSTERRHRPSLMQPPPLEFEADSNLDASTHKGQLSSDSREKILALYDEYRPRLFRYLGSMQMGRDLADEVIQETFMRLTAELMKPTEIENVQGWIVRVAHNLAVDLLKKQRAPVIATDNILFFLANRADPALSPEEEYSKKEQSRRMKSALHHEASASRMLRDAGARFSLQGYCSGTRHQRAEGIVCRKANGNASGGTLWLETSTA